MVKIAPSMLSADFLHLETDVRMVNRNADIFHLDIMDGVFVPNISYGFPIVEAIAKEACKPLDAHLMIVNPEKYVERFAKAGVSMLSFHLNAAQNPSSLVGRIRELGMTPGIAINPDIPVESLFPYLKDCGFVLIMSVFAGFGGQKFIPETLDRLAAVKAEIVRLGTDCLVEVDGGISPDNASAVVNAGADIL
ncbi:MAG: ribulose-phosphate 3-epimerase, partial [Candidatus Cryptobacteroides sp.]